jgi:leucyl aminopeptidase
MEIKIDSREFHEIECDALVVAIFEGEKPENGVLADIDRRSNGVVSSLVETGELTGKSGESAYVHTPGDMKARRLLLLGVGKKEEFTTDGVRKMVGTAARALRGKKARSFTILRRSRLPVAEGAQAATEGALISLFDPDKYHTSDKTENPLQTMTLLAPAADAGDVGRGVERGRIIAEATNFARELINEPANVITPTELARRAEEMAREFGLEFDALGEAQMKELGMGAFLGVAQGSSEPAKLITLTYSPMPNRKRPSPLSAKASRSTPEASRSSPRTGWRR